MEALQEQNSPNDESVEDEILPKHVDTSRNGAVVTVASARGGDGKSSVALLLGTALAQASKKTYEAGLIERPLDVVVVDLDILDSQIGLIIGQKIPTILDVFESATQLDPATIMNNIAYSEPMGLHALLAPNFAQEAKYTTPEFYREIIRTLKTMFDFVILDTSGQNHNNIEQTVALPEADAILYVAALDFRSVKAMLRWFNVAVTPISEGGKGIELNKIGVVVNRTVQGVGIELKDIQKYAFGAPLLVGIPLDSASFHAAANANRLESLLYHPTIGPAYLKLANRLIHGGNLLPLIDDNNTQ